MVGKTRVYLVLHRIISRNISVSKTANMAATRTLMLSQETYSCHTGDLWSHKLVYIQSTVCWLQFQPITHNIKTPGRVSMS